MIYDRSAPLVYNVPYCQQEARRRFANVRTLKTNTVALLQAVEEGEEVIIPYHGKPKAALVKLTAEGTDKKTPKRKPGVWRKNHAFLKLIGTASDESGLHRHRCLLCGAES